MSKLGPTGRFPLGKLQPDDRGELACAITTKNGQVMLQFGTSVTWLSLPPEDARRLALVLIEKADSIDGRTEGQG